MNANLSKERHCSNIPAGLFFGTEIFAANGIMYALYQGNRILFENLPSSEKRVFLMEFMNDKNGQRFLRSAFGIVGVESQFRQWLFCKFGSLDGDPDETDGKVVPDVYNSACKRKDCPGRGKFCGVRSGLKGYEVETLRMIAAGMPEKEVASRLNVSYPTVKSRVEKCKTFFGVLSLPALISKVSDMGVLRNIENIL